MAGEDDSENRARELSRLAKEQGIADERLVMVHERVARVLRAEFPGTEVRVRFERGGGLVFGFQCYGFTYYVTISDERSRH